LANIKNANIKQITVTGYTGSLLNIYNVTGSGLNGANILTPKKFPEPLAASGGVYKLQ